MSLPEIQKTIILLNDSSLGNPTLFDPSQIKEFGINRVAECASRVLQELLELLVLRDIHAFVDAYHRQSVFSLVVSYLNRLVR
ncbi:hypothetical protein [Bradyrhizobium sp. ORS 86]|uniref:hypothetical protein n=1 Tax=Bradyrhizobium sp. ORS 86 TaxID=1685970 RepID=UPI00388E1CD2